MATIPRIIPVFVFSGCIMLGVGYAQDKKVRTQEFHLKRAKRDKTIALVTGGVSVASLIGGIIYDNRAGEGIGEVLGNGVNAVMLYGTSLTTGLTSIGFAIGSGVHRKKAAAIEPIVYANRFRAPHMDRDFGRPIVYTGVLVRF